MGDLHAAIMAQARALTTEQQKILLICGSVSFLTPDPLVVAHVRQTGDVREVVFENEVIGLLE